MPMPITVSSTVLTQIFSKWFPNPDDGDWKGPGGPRVRVLDRFLAAALNPQPLPPGDPTVVLGVRALIDKAVDRVETAGIIVIGGDIAQVVEGTLLDQALPRRRALPDTAGAVALAARQQRSADPGAGDPQVLALCGLEFLRAAENLDGPAAADVRRRGSPAVRRRRPAPGRLTPMGQLRGDSSTPGDAGVLGNTRPGPRSGGPPTRAGRGLSGSPTTAPASGVTPRPAAGWSASPTPASASGGPTSPAAPWSAPSTRTEPGSGAR